MSTVERTCKPTIFLCGCAEKLEFNPIGVVIKINTTHQDDTSKYVISIFVDTVQYYTLNKEKALSL